MIVGFNFLDNLFNLVGYTTRIPCFNISFTNKMLVLKSSFLKVINEKLGSTLNIAFLYLLKSRIIWSGQG
jgi:hypothetical protein